MAYLLLVKHSFPAIVPGIPANEWHLSEVGRKRCLPLAHKLAAFEPDIIISSLEPKAVETAQIVAQKLNLPFKTAQDLQEHERRSIHFSSREKFEAAVHRFFERPDELVFGEETASQAWKRFSQTVESLLAGHPDQTVMIVSHGTVISLFITRACGIQPFPFWQRLGLPSFVVLTLPQLGIHEIVEEVHG